MNVFPSKIDLWLGALLVLSAVLVAVASASLLVADVPGDWLIVIPMVLVGCGVPLWILGSTRYTITAPMLFVQSGPIRLRIPLAEITRITPTRNPLSSPALSLDRLRIEYGHGNVCMVSPRDKDGFLRELHSAGAQPGLQRGPR